MTNRDRNLNFNIPLDPTHPQILEGLEAWLRLGLLSDAQVKTLCRQSLSCPLPIVVPTQPPPQLVRSAVSKPPVPSPQPALVPQPPNLITRLLQSFMAELSVVWLLVLGVFLVVVSSGVLAASQWERFNSTGQYLILLAYTVIFWGVSTWSSSQVNLRLTAETLRLVTLLLIPVNFWAMDGLQLWRYPIGGIIAFVSALILTGIAVLLFHYHQPQARKIQKLPLHLIGASFLQWGWAIPGFPFIAVYLGMGGTLLQTRFVSPPILSLTRLFLGVYALLILLLRAIFVAQVSIPQLGLAIALGGWLLENLESKLPLKERNSNLTQWLHRCEFGLLGLGWFVSVATVPWQALAVSGLGLAFFNSRLRKTWQKLDLGLLFVIGLQSVFLVWRLLPVLIQDQAIAILTQLTHSQAYPVALLGVVLFPYVFVILRVSTWLERQQQRDLVQFSEATALVFGVTLTLITLPNSLLTTVNLFASTLTLAWVYQKHPRIQLIYLTHTTGLLTLFSAIHTYSPALNSANWGQILLLFLLVEWGFYTQKSRQKNHFFPLWQSSAWHLGLALAGISYFLLANAHLNEPNSSIWWLITPGGLTFVASQQPAKSQKIATLSLTTLGLALLLTLSVPEIRLLSLAIAVWVMILNTRYLQKISATAITLGLAISFLAVFIYEKIPNFSVAGWLEVSLLVILSLWGFRSQSLRQPNLLASLYAQAADGWAIAIATFVLTTLLILPTAPETNRILPIEATGIASLFMVATTYRSQQQPRQKVAMRLSVITLILATLPTLTLPSLRLIPLGVATGLMILQTRDWHYLVNAVLSLGCGLSFLVLLLWDNIWGLPALSLSGWFLVTSLAVVSLWLGWGWGINAENASSLRLVYTKAADGWAIALCGVLGVTLALHATLVYWGWLVPDGVILTSIGLTLGAIVYRSQFWKPLNIASNWSFYSLGFGLELFATETLGFFDRSILSLAIANLGLGLATQLLGDFWHRRYPGRIPQSWHILPLIYGIFGALLRWGSFTATTGLTTLVLSFIFLGIGCRRQAFKPLVYLGLIGVSLSASEILVYQTITFPRGDRLAALAALGTSIIYAYQMLTPLLVQGLHLHRQEVKRIEYLHAAGSSVLALSAIALTVEFSQLILVATGVFLIRYAIFQGRNPANRRTGELWVYLGLFGSGILGAYCLNVPLIKHTIERLPFSFVPWRPAIGSLIAYFLYILPWHQWGWSNQPWKRAAYLLPLLMIFATLIVTSPHPLSLIITAGFYLFLAHHSRKIRFTYISLGLANWVVFNQLIQWGILSPLVYITVFALSCLYLIQVEPRLKSPNQRQTRHFFRLASISLICFTALFTESWILAGALSLIALFIGLGLQIRAFLYVGTLTLILNVLNQLLILNSLYAFMKWIILFIVGIGLISIAANFETRRTQFAAVIRSLQTQLQDWE